MLEHPGPTNKMITRMGHRHPNGTTIWAPKKTPRRLAVPGSRVVYDRVQVTPRSPAPPGPVLARRRPCPSSASGVGTRVVTPVKHGRATRVCNAGRTVTRWSARTSATRGLVG